MVGEKGSDVEKTNSGIMRQKRRSWSRNFGRGRENG